MTSRTEALAGLHEVFGDKFTGTSKNQPSEKLRKR